jgi:hypothetical protein
MTENDSKKKETNFQIEQPASATNTNQPVLYTHSYNTPPMSLDRLHRVERWNMVRLGYLIEAGPDHPLIKAGEAHSKKTRRNTFIYEPVYDHIKKVFNQLVYQKGTPIGVLNTEFLQPHGDSGRLNARANISLQVTSRYIRHAVSGEYYFDVDIVNAHPVLLAHYCDKYKIRCSALKRMIKHRDAIFEEVLRSNPKLEREDVKKAVLALLNGGTTDYKKIRNKPDDLVEFADEIAMIIQDVANLNKSLLNEVRNKRKKDNKDYNHEGAVMCRILQDLENQCLECMEDVCVEYGVPLEQMIPIHDGMQLPRLPVVEEKLDEILRACEVAVKERLDVTVSIVSKPMDSHLKVEGFEWPDDSDMHYCNIETKEKKVVIPFNPQDDIYDITEYFRDIVFDNRETMVSAMVDMLPKVIRMVQFPEAYIVNKGRINQGENVRESWCVNLEKTVSMQFSYRTDNGEKIKKLDAFPEVLRALPMYKGITFNPNIENVDPRLFNMYNGFKAREVPDVDMSLIQPILNHIRITWCNDNTDIFDYVIQWLRQAFAEPWNKTGVVLLLYSGEGTGKGIIIDQFIKDLIYGDQNSLTIQGLGKIVQRFNSALMNKMLVCANEVNSETGFHDTFDTLKALITDPTFCPEKKGLDIMGDFPIPCNFIFTTNNHNSVKLGKSDRRYLCLEVSDKYRGNWDYFANLDKYIKQVNADHFYTYVKRLPKTRELRQIPMTDLKREMLVGASSSFELFIEDLKAEFPIEHRDNMEEWVREIAEGMTDCDKNIEVSAGVLYKSYKAWCVFAHEKIRSAREFGVEMKKLLQFKKNSKIVYAIQKMDSVVETDDDVF